MLYICKRNLFFCFLGFVVRKALSIIHCEVCRESLVAKTSSTVNREAFILLTLKNNGGLVTPSDGVLIILSSAEKHLRNLTEISTIRRTCSLLRLQCLVLQHLGSSDVLSLQAHAAETLTQVDNHYTDIIRLVVSIFLILGSTILQGNTIWGYRASRLGKNTISLSFLRVNNRYKWCIKYWGQEKEGINHVRLIYFCMQISSVVASCFV